MMYEEENKIGDLRKASVQRLTHPLFAEKQLHADVLRLDKIHPVVSGNKWFKLKYYLEEAGDKGYKTLLTFGGAFSNHIIATAFAAKASGLECIGVIRGEQPSQLSHTLQEAAVVGMRFHFVSRKEYRQKEDPQFLQQLKELFGEIFIIPEGGAGAAGVRGAVEIADLTEKHFYTHIIAASGTGTMLQGLLRASDAGQQVIGIPVLKNENMQVIDQESGRSALMMHGYHFGGYAKHSPLLLSFMNSWWQQTGIPSDFVYTGKLFYACSLLAENNFFPKGSRLLIIHSGGLQGNRSLAGGTLFF
jgi:1-aminocyclopropane-1-carboxylate deaminase